jgi:uncharacterized protein (UPF0333 family)
MAPLLLLQLLLQVPDITVEHTMMDSTVVVTMTTANIAKDFMAMMGNTAKDIMPVIMLATIPALLPVSRFL